MGRGLAFSIVGAVVGAVIWVVLIRVTGWSLWILAPIVGGSAGYGMMRGTQMRGGTSAGVIAAALTVAGVFAARYVVVNTALRDELTYEEWEIIDELAYDVAAEWEELGREIYDEYEDDFLPAVYDEADRRWVSMSDAELDEYVATLEADAGMTAAWLTPIGLLFDFGFFGLICTALAAGTAYKCGSITLEEALIEQGHAINQDDAVEVAENLRTADGGSFSMLGPRAPLEQGGTPEGRSVPGEAGFEDVPRRAI